LTTAGFAFFNVKGIKKQMQKKKKGISTPMDNKIEGITCFDNPSMLAEWKVNQTKLMIPVILILSPSLKYLKSFFISFKLSLSFLISSFFFLDYTILLFTLLIRN
jgi:hypothetical protein